MNSTELNERLRDVLRQIVGKEVVHQKYGEGVVLSFQEDNNLVQVKFGDNVKNMSSDNFFNFHSPKDETLKSVIQSAKDEYAKSEAEFDAVIAKRAAANKEASKARPIDDFHNPQYEFLSNFYSHPVTYKGITYQNNEAAFQAQKDVRRSHEFASLTPGSAKHLGKRVNLRPDWEEVKLGIMEEICRIKFSDEDLKQKLIATFPSRLIEGNTWNDTFWGVSKKTGKGRNHLGEILMKIRADLMP